MRSILLLPALFCSIVLASKVYVLDDGVRKDVSMQSNATFCYNRQTNYKVRMDEWDSDRQPYVVQYFGRFTLMRKLYTGSLYGMQKMQRVAWVFRSFFWTWSDLRVDITGKEPMSYTYIYSKGRICRVVEYWTKPGYVSKYVMPNFVLDLNRFVNAVVAEFCVGCSEKDDGCSVDCEMENGDTCTLVLSPYQSPCVTVYWKDFRMLSLQREVEFSIQFYSVLSLRFLQYLVLGVVLHTFSYTLAKSRSFHYVLGCIGGIMLSIVLAVYAIYKQTRSLVDAVPGGNLLASSSGLTSIVFPVTGLVLLPYVKQFFHWTLQILHYFWHSESFMGIPHLGKLYFILFGTMGSALVWWYQWCASDAREPEPEMHDILKDDTEERLTPQQQKLEYFLKLTAFVSLLHCTSTLDTSLVIMAMVYGFKQLQQLFNYCYFWYYYEKPGAHSELITKQEYNHQSTTETKKALRQLRQHLQSNTHEWERVSIDNEIRVRRFANGKSHLQELEFDNDDILQTPPSYFSTKCQIQ